MRHPSLPASRRAFLQRSGMLGLAAATPWAMNLAALGEAAAQTAITDCP